MPADNDAKRLRRAYFSYRTVAFILKAFPRRLAISLAQFVALRLADKSQSQFSVVSKNLQPVLDTTDREQLDKTVYQAYKDYGRYWAEVARLGRSSISGLKNDWTIEGGELLEEALAVNGKVVLALPHLGSWEIGALWFARQGWKVTTVAEAIQPKELFDWFTKKREKLGLRILPLSVDATTALAKVLNGKGMVALVADRDISGGGVEVQFFGRKAKLPGGPALLALRNDAVLLPCAVYQQPHGKAHGVILPAIDTTRQGQLRQDVTRVTQELASKFEYLIKKAPSQWHAFQPIFLEDETDATVGNENSDERGDRHR